MKQLTIDSSYTIALPGNAHIFWLMFRGSVANGTYADDSEDIDLIGAYIAPANYYLGVAPYRETFEFKHHPYDVVLYEFKHLIRLLLKGNPNVMSMLWTPKEFTKLSSPISQTIVNNHALFIGRHVCSAFTGYAHSQLRNMKKYSADDLARFIGLDETLIRRKIHPANAVGNPNMMLAAEYEGVSDEELTKAWTELGNRLPGIGRLGAKRKALILKYGWDVKAAAHTIRLLCMLRDYMKTSEIVPYRPERDFLIKIKQGAVSVEDVMRMIGGLLAQIEELRVASKMRPDPETDGVDRLVVELLKKRVDEELAERALAVV